MKTALNRWPVVMAFVAAMLGLAMLAPGGMAPPSGGEEIVAWVDTNATARAAAYENYAQFVVAQFAFDADRVTNRRINYRAIQRLINRAERDLEKELKRAERDIKNLVKDGKRALRRDRAGGDGNRRTLEDIEDARLNVLQGARAGALAAMYEIANAATAP